MIGRLFRRDRKNASPALPVAPPGAVVWAIGDVHGRRDLLDPLLDLVLNDFATSRRMSRRVVVMLGDYVDRGPDSRGVLERLAQLEDDAAVETHLLCGNHDAVMRAFLDEPEQGPRWSALGATQTLAAYGVAAPGRKDAIEAWSAARQALVGAMPARHRRLLDALKPSVACGGYFFCHAGARPGVALDAQSPRDLMWIRGAFLRDDAPFERMVVHGHTPTRAVHVDHRRIGLDTGAHFTGVLSGLRLEGATRALVQTGTEAGRVTLTARPLST